MRYVLALLLLVGSPDDLSNGLKTIRAADIQRHQVYLASDDLEGRDSGSAGGHKAALYIVDHLQKCGFEPGASDGSWFQPFKGAPEVGDLADANCVRLYKDASMKADDAFKLGEHVMPIQHTKTGGVTANVVFAGYGISAPELSYEDYKTANAKGAIALVLEGGPPGAKADITHKIEQAEKAGAVALLVISKTLPNADTWPPPADKREVMTKIPVVLVSGGLGEALAKAASKSIKTLQEEIDKDLKPKTFKVARPARVSVAFAGQIGKGVKNVLGMWRGGDEKLKGETIILGAHYDHVGRGTTRSNGGKSGEIHNGADDNGSGTSTLLEIAEAIKETKPKRSILLIWFDSEENGLEGSRHWCGSPTVSTEKVPFMINLDMMGRNDIKQILLGVEKKDGTPVYPKLAALMQECERKFQVKFDWKGADDLIQRSDHWNFMQKGIPAIFFTGGLHADYHTERDDVEKINFPKEELIAKLAFWLAMKTANQDGGLK